MVVEKGYKQTEVGVIPEDWEVKEFGQICSPSKSKFNPLISSNIPCIELEDLSQNTGRLLSISNSEKKTSLKTVFEKGDVLLGKLRPYLRKFFYPNFDGVCSTEIWALKSKPWVHSNFLFYQVQSDKIIEAANLSTGTKMPRAEWKTVSETKVLLPPLSEQTAIASALSDMDQLIAQYEKLIEKKKAIKQGVMQELLRPKEGWEVKKLGEVLKIRHGKDQKSVQSLNGSFPILGTGGLMGFASNFLYDKPSVLIGRKGTIDKPQFMDKPFWTVDTLFYSEISNTCNPRFIFYLFKLIDWKSYNEASGVPSLNAKTIESIEAFIPSLEIQTRIAKTILDIEKSVSMEESKLQKLKLQKQGMMQALLTGKIRLI